MILRAEFMHEFGAFTGEMCGLLHSVAWPDRSQNGLLVRRTRFLFSAFLRCHLIARLAQVTDKRDRYPRRILNRHNDATSFPPGRKKVHENHKGDRAPFNATRMQVVTCAAR